jgi:preprotein translocase subunit SecE
MKRIKKFFAETTDELKKSTWPDRRELGRATLIVIIGMLLISIYVSAVDFSLLSVVDFVGKCVKN